MLLVTSMPVLSVGGGSIAVGDGSVDWRLLGFLWWGYLAKTWLSVVTSQCATRVRDPPWILFHAASSDTSARYRRVPVAALKLCGAMWQLWCEEVTSQRCVVNDNRFFLILPSFWHSHKRGLLQPSHTEKRQWSLQRMAVGCVQCIAAYLHLQSFWTTARKLRFSLPRGLRSQCTAFTAIFRWQSKGRK